MGRKKVIDDNILIELIQSFWSENCYDPTKLKLPDITEYVRSQGYPQYAVESLRRNEKARDYIRSLQNSSENVVQRILIAYKTIDVETLLDTHRTRASLKKALMDLDQYYKSIANAAMEIGKRNQFLEKQYESISGELNKLREENSALLQGQETLKTQIKCLKTERQALRGIVDDYVYPDIANELLLQAGVLSGNTMVIDPEKLECKIVSGSTIVNSKAAPLSGSNVIQGLFDILEE